MEASNLVTVKSKTGIRKSGFGSLDLRLASHKNYRQRNQPSTEDNTSTMMSEYYNTCSIFEPIMDFLPCSSYSQQQLPAEDDLGTPRHSNRSPVPDSGIKSVPSTMSETSHFTEEHISSLQKIGRREPDSNMPIYYHHDHHHYGLDPSSANYEQYKVPPQSQAQQSSWFPSFMASGAWYASDKYKYDNMWHRSYQRYYPEAHSHSLHSGYYQQQEDPQESQEQLEPDHTTELKEAPKFTETNAVEVSPSPSESREDLCPTPSSVSTAVTNSIESKRQLRTLDIVCGRGAPTNFHYGNQVFKELVEDHQTTYLCSKRSDKPHIAMKILDLVKANGGRFVRRQRTAEGLIWQEINDKGAYEKICQALREGAPDLRRQVLSKMKQASVNRPHDSD